MNETKKFVIIRKNSYSDSVTLMSLSGKIRKMEGIKNAIISMATNMNKELIEKENLSNEEVKKCTENDLIIAVECDLTIVEEELLKVIDEKLKGDSTEEKKGEVVYSTMDSAYAEHKDSDIAVISIPGEYAAREAKKALEKGMNVMLFSDNVTIEQERDLKNFAHDRELLVMGPDCGTAIINGVGLCFSNKVKRGKIGVAGASGTGMQEVIVLADRYGAGISNAIGVGGRDLSAEIGGIMMMDALRMLQKDTHTEVILMVSKLPDLKVKEKLLQMIEEEISKPVVIAFTTDKKQECNLRNVYFASSLQEAAQKASELTTGLETLEEETELAELPVFAKDQKYIRGLYCGGTLCQESFYYLKGRVGEVYSNVAKEKEYQLKDVFKSEGHTLLDLGDDFFTTGRAHPMIDPTIRLSRILEECERPDTAVILLDFEIGYGVHEDPVGASLDAIKDGIKLSKEAGHEVKFVTYVQGTNKDKQNKGYQEKLLEDCGCIVAKSNIEAIRLAYKMLGL